MRFFFFKPKPPKKDYTMGDIADLVNQALAAAQGAQAAATSVANNIQSLTETVSALTTTVQALQSPPPATVDFTPVLEAIAAVSAQLVPTPPALATTAGSGLSPGTVA